MCYRDFDVVGSLNASEQIAYSQSVDVQRIFFGVRYGPFNFGSTSRVGALFVRF